jgi:hypothetical protein
VYLVHGTFLGDDALGLLRALARVQPNIAGWLKQRTKRTVDRLASDAGNYTAEYARGLEAMLNGPPPDPTAAGHAAEGEPGRVPVRLFHWSSENHHLARAQAAVSLIDELSRQRFPPESRVLLWGHSHGGNVLALVTNLLAAEPAARRAFFRAVRGYYRPRRADRHDADVWLRVRQWLDADPRLRIFPQLDIVTFGTPIRYGWDCGGFANLLHFVHHRPREGLPVYQTTWPRSVDELQLAVDGDYVQFVGVAGTNFAPPVFDWRAWTADRRLNRLLQGHLRKRDLPARLQAGQRVAADGTTLLVDYGGEQDPGPHALAGHAVYTRRIWLAFHLEQVACHFYGHWGGESASVASSTSSSRGLDQIPNSSLPGT